MREHIYRHGWENRKRREFRKIYGKKKGDYVYGAVVGKVRRVYKSNRSSSRVRKRYKKFLGRFSRFLR